jgi:hypothetical protein
LSIREYDESGHETYRYIEEIYANGTKTTDEYNYVIYNDRSYTESSYAYRLYEYGEEWWNKYEYSYDFTNGCVAYVTFTNSYGDYNTYTEDCHHITWGYVKTPSCTQSGIISHYCMVCGYYDEAEEVEPFCHDWQYDYYKNTYVCACCGLENANGASGDIVIEDLTAKYGNGDFYVVGYYVRSNASFGKYIDVLINGELITLDETKIGILEHDTARAYLISKADIEAQLKELGYADAEYNVVFTFVPDDAIGNLDYAITFSNDYLAPDVKEISGNATVSGYTENGKTVDYTIIVEKKSEWIFESFASSDTRVYLYCDKFQVENDDGGLNNNFRLSVELEPGVYTLSVRWFSSDTSGHFSFTATKNDIEEETCNHILNGTHYKKLMDKKTGCIPSDTPGIKAFADMPFDDYEPGEIIKAYFVCEICGEVITCNVIIV